MGLIQVLPEHIANKIAAGEVIERPASIVKELIENSLDAGASSIDIEINHGGKSLIRVADDGSGMEAGDAELAFRRHATSKIRSADDLNGIASFGFRGEALPSIAAVSRVTVQTRTRDASGGIELKIEGGSAASAREAAISPGTVVEVRDLFFNTPARRKFLKSDSTELGHVMDAVSHFALSHPELRIVFRSSGRTVFDLMPVSDVLVRAEAVLGAETARHLLAIDEEANQIRIRGLIGKPFVARANRTGQSFFINRRWVRSIGLSHALLAGYHGVLMHGQHPLAVIFIEVPLDRVDVNVHPTKQEVRLSHENEIKSLLKKAVAGRLREEGDISPEMKPFESSPAPAASFPVLPPGEPKRDPVSLYAADLEKSFATASGESRAAEEQVFYAPAAPASLETPISIRNKLNITKILGQIHGTFIVAETEEGMMIIDQHAAHEKVMFETLVSAFEQGNPARQSLLMDEILELHPRQMQIMEEALELLNRLGFEIERFGETSFVVRGYPAILGNENPLSFLKTFVEEKEEGNLHTRLENYREEIAALFACKRQSVKAHESLSAVHLQKLLERLSRCESPFSCPHGRPTLFKKTFLELEKQFKRK